MLYKDLGIWEYNSSPVLIAAPRLFECFEMRAPWGRIEGVLVELHIK